MRGEGNWWQENKGEDCPLYFSLSFEKYNQYDRCSHRKTVNFCFYCASCYTLVYDNSPMVNLLDVVGNRVSSYPKTGMGRNVSFFIKAFFLDAEVGRRRRIIEVVTTWILKTFP